MARVVINGLGRIGRALLKIVVDSKDLELVAVNDLATAEDLAYLLAYDTVYGRWDRSVSAENGALVVGSNRLPALREKDLARLPWKDLGVDVVFECTGAFTRREDMAKHLAAGAKFVILSAPSKSEDVETVVHAVNTAGPAQIISCASCTTNCITPIVEIIGRRIGFHKAGMTTVHAYTATQALVDGSRGRKRRGRAAAVNIVPASTGAAVATSRALPQYRGRLDGLALRVPVAIGSIADLTFLTTRRTTIDEVNGVLAEESNTKRYADVLGVTRDALVSSDIIRDPRASLVDLSLTMVIDGDLVKVLSWYDNEWGYAHQMVREALRMLAAER